MKGAREPIYLNNCKVKCPQEPEELQVSSAGQQGVVGTVENKTRVSVWRSCGSVPAECHHKGNRPSISKPFSLPEMLEF